MVPWEHIRVLQLEIPSSILGGDTEYAPLTSSDENETKA